MKKKSSLSFAGLHDISFSLNSTMDFFLVYSLGTVNAIFWFLVLLLSWFMILFSEIVFLFLFSSVYSVEIKELFWSLGIEELLLIEMVRYILYYKII